MIEFKKTNIDNLNKYIKLYKKAFKNFTKSYNYFNWLYVDNPQGSFVGVDCYDDDILIGQVGGIPHDFIFNKKKVKFLISINVCVDPKYQGQGIFSKLLLKFEQTAKDLDFDGIIAVANKAASQPWQRSVKLKKLKALDVFVGYGKLNLDRFKKDVAEEEKEYIHKSTLFWCLSSIINITIHIVILLSNNINYWIYYSSVGWYFIFIFTFIIQMIHLKIFFRKVQNV